jgi:RimJ/RimL family protein N-acetyltransferase
MNGIRQATMNDTNFIKKLYDNHNMIKYLTDDNSPSLVDIGIENIISAESIYPIISMIGETPSKNVTDTGLFLFFPWNYTTYELHVAILPEYRGRHSVDSGILAGKWMFNNTCCRKIVTMIPVPNYKAKALALAVGMQQEGLNRKSYCKDGVLYDQYLYGICKEDVQ